MGNFQEGVLFLVRSRKKRRQSYLERKVAFQNITLTASLGRDIMQLVRPKVAYKLKQIESEYGPRN
ncbi:MAG: hypothetical protein A2842_01450 [Candidatus Wildermuthbacteria bacterium RIFCSPHIGHO2_01_FULL_48_25]|uniref:Uncharacterized protein n=1 Tax=Candidatus Wildermuthbacteria bacterium RIFCSPLOWO2_01_FULL_48_16 TaxID=1802461 RepID=A0A1G2RIY3_9BACT|nr:MAG: hypothetical protein A2842_01450 [Candidatus Wildermuthbacteria bacterium RIFCSPHIGHO2_01_FULL_48_25]OHA69106.1 MAG: hypothetical protein A3J57_00510 [Candidatus Wildermuthbacteria bacterium RIFCSPHIGHO2_02_FULL_49_12b]OHA72813.1 MAG: hypothetical protein A3B24_02800 [Candidatus Wildermuthbacteria bacterium RIFCSPLOWO2_01_FULL_48_16]